MRHVAIVNNLQRRISVALGAWPSASSYLEAVSVESHATTMGSEQACHQDLDVTVAIEACVQVSRVRVQWPCSRERLRPGRSALLRVRPPLLQLPLPQQATSAMQRSRPNGLARSASRHSGDSCREIFTPPPRIGCDMAAAFCSVWRSNADARSVAAGAREGPSPGLLHPLLLRPRLGGRRRCSGPNRRNRRAHRSLAP
jgi:hypothetical protein